MAEEKKSNWLYGVYINYEDGQRRTSKDAVPAGATAARVLASSASIASAVFPPAAPIAGLVAMGAQGLSYLIPPSRQLVHTAVRKYYQAMFEKMGLTLANTDSVFWVKEMIPRPTMESLLRSTFEETGGGDLIKQHLGKGTEDTNLRHFLIGLRDVRVVDLNEGVEAPYTQPLFLVGYLGDENDGTFPRGGSMPEGTASHISGVTGGASARKDGKAGIPIVLIGAVVAVGVLVFLLARGKK